MNDEVSPSQVFQDGSDLLQFIVAKAEPVKDILVPNGQMILMAIEKLVRGFLLCKKFPATSHTLNGLLKMLSEEGSLPENLIQKIMEIDKKYTLCKNGPLYKPQDEQEVHFLLEKAKELEVYLYDGLLIQPN